MSGIEDVCDWLLDGAPGATTSEQVADGLAARIAAAGVPLDRMVVLVTTLHPNVLGRGFFWERGKPVEVRNLTPEARHSPGFANSPVAHVLETGEGFRWRTGGPDGGFGIVRDLREAGYTEYVVFPLRFTNGEVHCATFASKERWTERHVEALERVVRPLSRLAEILALRRTASNILSTYVGAHAGERVLAGKIFRGDVDTIRAAIWFSDMRGFTEMSGRLGAKEVVRTLNEVFECQVPAIEKRGGSVLKFMGDGLLAIFPIGADAPASVPCKDALDAAAEALEALDALNAGRSSPLRIGIALHVGDVEYGNIGGSSRLDFTAIGPAVNMASRLEGLTSKLGRPVVVSADFAANVSRRMEELGRFELKGIEGAQRVLAPAPAS